MLDPAILAAFLTNRFGLDVQAERMESPDGALYRIRPEGVAPTIGFSLDFVVGWRSVSARFVPGNFAAGLVRAMENASHDQIAVFDAFIKNAVDQGAVMRMHVNDVPAEVRSPDHWPKDWRSVRFDFRKGALLLDSHDNDKYRELVLPWAARFFGAILSLLPVEPMEDKASAGEEEGRLIEMPAKRYERSHINRAACIELHGVTCKACGMAFTDCYGSIGQDFIHVHHLEPLSMMDGPYILNPATDLVPVCPNCHAMLHKRRPPFTVEELKDMLIAKFPV